MEMAAEAHVGFAHDTTQRRTFRLWNIFVTSCSGYLKCLKGANKEQTIGANVLLAVYICYEFIWKRDLLAI